MTYSPIDPLTKEDLSVIEGTVTWRRSASSDCICCPGKHVYSVYLEMASGGHLDVSRWFYDAIDRFPEGARIRLSLRDAK